MFTKWEDWVADFVSDDPEYLGEEGLMNAFESEDLWEQYLYEYLIDYLSVHKDEKEEVLKYVSGFLYKKEMEEFEKENNNE